VPNAPSAAPPSAAPTRLHGPGHVPGPLRPGVGPRAAGDRHGGFALLATLLVLLGLSALASGGLILAGTEASAARTHAAGVRAFLAAQAALATFLSTEPAAADDSIRVDYAFGPRTTARLQARRLLRLDAFRGLYRVTASGSYAAGRDRGARLLGTLAFLDGAPIRVPAALTSGGGLRLDGEDVELDGHGSPSADSLCSGAGPVSVAGAAFPSGGYAQSAAGPLQASGEPDTASLPAASLDRVLGVDWGELASGAPAFDARLPADPWPAGGAPGDPWPGILVDLPSFQVDAGRSGRGALVVTGDLLLGDGFRWEGLLLVGGALRTQGAATITGGVVTGLAGDAGGSPPVARLGPGAVSIRYDACAVARAGRFAATLAPAPGSWWDAFSVAGS
jgi:hypothetical protein